MSATSASGSRSKRCRASSNWRTTSSLTALSLSGRFSVIVAILSAQEYSTKFCSSVSTIPSREAASGGQLAGGGGGGQRQPPRFIAPARPSPHRAPRGGGPDAPPAAPG